MITTFKFFDNSTNPTKEDLAKRLYPNESFDYALPQSWVDGMIRAGFEDCTGHFVWLYPPHTIEFGRPAPLTARGIEILACYSLRAGRGE